MWARRTDVGPEAHDVEGIFEVSRRAGGKDRSLGARELTSSVAQVGFFGTGGWTLQGDGFWFRY